MNHLDLADLADTIAARHPLPWRAAGIHVLDATGSWCGSRSRARACAVAVPETILRIPLAPEYSRE